MEFVYVVKRDDLFDLSFPHGFVAARDDGRVAQWSERIRERGFFVERRQAERDRSLKQVIPYTLVAHGDEVLLRRRLARGGEARLHGKLSIGVGGHINPIDGVEARDVLEAGCRRELDEELVIDTSYALSAVGVINDETNDVGSVHFGLVNVARCETADVTIRETDVLEGTFTSRAALVELLRSPPRPHARDVVAAGRRTPRRGAGMTSGETIWHITRDGTPAVPGTGPFVHASFTSQLAGTLALHFVGVDEVVLLRLDPAARGADGVFELAPVAAAERD